MQNASRKPLLIRRFRCASAAELYFFQRCEPCWAASLSPQAGKLKPKLKLNTRCVAFGWIFSGLLKAISSGSIALARLFQLPSRDERSQFRTLGPDIIWRRKTDFGSRYERCQTQDMPAESR